MNGMRTLMMAALGVTLACAACNKDKKEEDTSATQGETPAQAESPEAAAKKYFKQKCVVCHGENGTGDGPGAAALDPKPRDYTDKEWQAKVKDEELKKAIVEGGAAVGKSSAMPPNPDLKDKPEMVNELVKIVRGFAK